MKELPKGIRDFETLTGSNCIYVAETASIHTRNCTCRLLHLPKAK
jgi:hypothetical protein